MSIGPLFDAGFAAGLEAGRKDSERLRTLLGRWLNIANSGETVSDQLVAETNTALWAATPVSSYARSPQEKPE